MNRVLILTDSITLNSGLARCGRELAMRFYNHAAWEVVTAGWHDMGVPHKYPFQIYPINRFAQDEPNRLFDIIARFRPHFVVAIGDIFYFQWLGELQRKVREELQHRCDWLGWITIDGDPIPPNQFPLLFAFDRVSYMSQFAKDQVEIASGYARQGLRGYNKNPKDVALALHAKKPVPLEHLFDSYALDALSASTVITPGVDMRKFYPLPGIPQWEGEGGHGYNKSNKFVILIVDQNTARKAVAAAIDAYMIFREGKEGKTALHVLTNPEDPNGVNLLEHYHTIGLPRDIVFHGNNPGHGIPEEELNKLYNMSSVLFSCTTGEGFKLPVLEAMATGCLNVMPAYSSLPEILLPDRGVLYEANAESYWYGTFGYRKRVVDLKQAVAGLERAYAALQTNTPMMSRAYTHANHQSWDKPFKEITTQLQEMYTKQPVSFRGI